MTFVSTLSQLNDINCPQFLEGTTLLRTADLYNLYNDVISTCTYPRTTTKTTRNPLLTVQEKTRQRHVAFCLPPPPLLHGAMDYSHVDYYNSRRFFIFFCNYNVFVTRIYLYATSLYQSCAAHRCPLFINLVLHIVVLSLSILCCTSLSSTLTPLCIRNA